MTESEQPQFWDERYASRKTPWDFGGVPRALREFLAREEPGRVLIPGCGCGYEVRAFAQTGWQVDAVDFSSEAVRLAREWLGDEGRFVRQADFFAENPNAPFDLVYERAFLCIFPPGRRQSYAAQVARCLRPGGRVAGFFFFGTEPSPPPYPLAPGELEDLLGENFTRIKDFSVTDSVPFFAGRERWQVWVGK